MNIGEKALQWVQHKNRDRPSLLSQFCVDTLVSKFVIDISLVNSYVVLSLFNFKKSCPCKMGIGPLLLQKEQFQALVKTYFNSFILPKRLRIHKLMILIMKFITPNLVLYVTTFYMLIKYILVNTFYYNINLLF